jgi:hypothetical protein
MFRRSFAIVLLLLWPLAACTVTLVAAYDEELDKGVSEFQSEFIAFTKELHKKAGMPVGTYAANAKFYETWDTKLDVLAERSQALDPAGKCPGTGLAGQLVGQIRGQLVSADATTLEQVQGGCRTQVLVMLRYQLADFALFHSLQPAGIPEGAGRPAEELMRIAIRAALQLVTK